MRLGVSLPRAAPHAWPAALGGPRVLIGSWRGKAWIPRAAKEFAIDLDAPTTEVPDDAPFHLNGAPDVAAARLRRLADLGFDDAVLVPRIQSEQRLAAIRALVR